MNFFDPWAVADLRGGRVAADLVRALDDAERLGPEAAGAAGAPLDVGPDATREVKILRLADLLPRLRRYAFGHRGCASPQRARTAPFAAALVDAVTTRVLPHVRVAGRARLTLADVVYQGLFVVRGAPFPFVHWDQDWGAFPGAAGFQVWCLVDGMAGAPPGFGNMFVAESRDLGVAEPPSRWDVFPDGRVDKAAYYGALDTMPVKSYASLEAAGLRFAYLNATPGDVAVFSKRTLHVSDPRPHVLRAADPASRVAVVWRVVVRRPDGAVPLWAGHLHAKRYAPGVSRNLSERAHADAFSPASRHGLFDRCPDGGPPAR